MGRCIGSPGESGRQCSRTAYRKFNDDPYCETCLIDRLVEEVERLTTIYATASVEVRFDYGKS